MTDSLKNKKVITFDDFKARMECVKSLQENEKGSYQVIKDRMTGEHYLQYHYLHLNIAEGGQEEVFYHLLPIDTDEVLSIVLGEKEYTYPDQWKGPILRSGAEGHLFWYDSNVEEEYQKYEEIVQEMQGKITEFKQKGSLDDDSIRKLMEDMDRMFGDK